MGQDGVGAGCGWHMGLSLCHVSHIVMMFSPGFPPGGGGRSW